MISLKDEFIDHNKMVDKLRKIGKQKVWYLLWSKSKEIHYRGINSRFPWHIYLSISNSFRQNEKLKR